MRLPQTIMFTGLGVLLASGCMSKKQMTMSDMATLKAEDHAMWSRPLEMGYEVIGDVQGEACTCERRCDVKVEARGRERKVSFQGCAGAGYKGAMHSTGAP